MSATDNFLQSLKQKGGARVGTMLALDPRTPDDTAEAMRVGGELGLPANVVAADPMGFKRQLDQKKNTTALTGAPKTAKWLQDINNGALAKDDVDNLTWFEKSMLEYKGMGEGAADSVPGRMVRRGGLRAAANVPQFKASSAAQVLADRGKTFDQIYEEIAGQYGPNAPASILTTAQQVAKIRFDNAQSADMTATAIGGANALAEARGIMARVEALPLSDTSTAFRDGPLKNTPDTLGGLAEAIWADPVGGAAFIAETAGEFLPALAAAAATTAVTRSPTAGSLILGSGSFLAENASSAQAFLSEKGVSMETPEEALAVLNNAELMREAGERGATRGMIIGALDALSGGVAGQALVKNPGADILLQTMAQMALGGGGEALATAAVGDEVNWKEVGLEALGEALTLPADLIIGGRTVRDMAASAQSGGTAAVIDELDRMAAASKLKQRSPEKFAEALDAQGEADFYVAAEDLREYFQAKDVPFDDETLRAWGVEPNDFAQAEAAGGDVTVSRSAYAARISGTEDAAWFRDNATTEPGEMSVSQATRFNSEVREVMERAIEDAEDQRAREIELRASDVQVYDSVFSQLREAGRTRDVADNEARVWSSFWRTMADRYGGDPLDLAQSMGVQIRGPQTPEISRRRNDLDIKLNTLRSNPQKALKPEGQDLLSFIRDKGGVSDTGGDLAAMDAPKGIIGETREQFEARRGQPGMFGSSEGRAMGLDELGRAAIEAGYFPELMGGADIQMDGTVVDEAAVLLEALQRAISGEAIYVEGQGPNPDMVALSDQLSQLGLDISEVSNDEIAAALEGGGQTFDQFAGPYARTANKSAMDLAVVALADGRDPEEVRAETGWFVGPDNALRFEISDREMEFLDGFNPNDFPDVGGFRVGVTGTMGSNIKLSDVLKHDAVFEAYPRIGDTLMFSMSKGAEDGGGIVGGGVDPRGDMMVINTEFWNDPAIPESRKREMIIHEIQHLIQMREGRSKGSNLDNGRDAYNSNMGEIEARATQRRANIPQRDRDIVPISFVGGEIDATDMTSRAMVMSADLVERARGRLEEAAQQQKAQSERQTVGSLVSAVRERRSDLYDALSADRLPDDTDDFMLASNFVNDRENFVEYFGQNTFNLLDGLIADVVDGPQLKTDTPAFREWFGDSKVVDADGNPLVVYHGTDRDFERFDAKENGAATRATSSKSGFFFTDDEVTAGAYANFAAEQREVANLVAQSEAAERRGEWDKANDLMVAAEQREREISDARGLNGQNIVQGYLSIQNPLIIDAKGEIPEGIGGIDPLIKRAKREGRDGVIIRNFDDAAGLYDRVSDHYIIFDPAQIKSVNNRGTFDRNDARILYQADPADVDAFVSGLKSRLGLRDLSMFVSGGDLKINMIAVEQDGQKKGTGSKAMAEIADFADKHGMRLTLTTGQRDDGFGTTSQSRLKRFYKRFGFVENKGRNKDFSISGNMYREPRLYQGEQTKRGSIRLPSGGLESGQTVINLFESANLSTFLHESGHFFLEAFTALATSDTAPQAMKDDLAAIHKFLKVDGSAPLTTAQHEMWARGFEAYAMEGKAPSLELADAFGRFKSWLTRIYRSIKGLNVKLTPEIREVMDRMLATDAEIAAARETQQMSPLFTDETASGMSPAAWKTYQRMARRSEEQATQALLEKTMAKVRREKEAWWKEERAQVRKEVENTVNSEPRYRLIEMLANQKWIGSDDAVPDFQLDRQELVDTFGDGVLAELSRSRFGGKRAIYGADGISLYEAAEFFGFANPVAMVETLQNTGKKKDAIELETDRIMSDRYGDPLNDGSIEEDALAAIHSDQQAQTVAAEARHLAGQAGRSTRNMTAKVFRQRARMMLSRMSVKDAIRPNAFLEAERKSAKRAEDAFARVAGGREAGAALAAASKHKEQQMLNHYLYMESRDLAAMVASKREKMRAYNKKSVREKLEGGYIEQIDAILEGYDFRVRSQGQVQRSEKLRAFVERMIEDGREGELDIDARLLDEANRKHYTKLSVEELQGLFDTIDNIDRLGRFKQTLADAKNKRDLQEVATTFANAISDRFGTGKAAKQSKQVRNFFNLLFSVDTMMVDLDGTEVGEVYDLFKAPLDRGQAQEQQMNVAMADAVQDIFSPYTSKELSQMQVAKVIPGGNGHAWSKMEIIGLALNTGNQDGRNRILEKTVHPERRLTQEQLDATLDTLEKADWDFVQSMIEQVNSYWPELAETHKRRKGTTLKKVEAVPIETKFGTYAGGYYPISYDSQRSIGAAKDEASAWDQFTAAGRGSRIEVRSGMTNERQQTSGGRTVDFDLNVALRHMRDTIRVISMSEVVDNAARIIKHKDVETAFMDAGQTNQFNTLKLFLDDLAVGPVYNTDPINSFARIVKNNFTMSKLAFNFKTVALQVTGITQSAVVVGKKNMVRGYRDYLANPNAAVQMAMEKSAFMSERKTSFQKDIYDQINDIQLSSPLAKRTTKAKNELGKAGFYPMIRVQFLTVDVPTWIAAHDAKLREGASDDAAVKYADRIVARAQGSGLYADRNALERGTVAQNLRQSDFIRLWTTLGSYMVTKMNRGYLAAQKGKRGFSEAQNTGEMVGTAINLASDMALLYMAEAIMMGLAYALLAGDDADEEDLQKFVLTNTATSVIGGVPIVSGVANAFQGYGAGGVLASVLEMPANVSVQISQGENDAALWRSVADGTGMLTGLPSTASYRAIEGLVRGVDEGELPLADMFFGSNPLTR